MALSEEPETIEPTPIHVLEPEGSTVESKRILVAAFALMTGAFGVHKFILGQTREGFIRLGITVLLVWTIVAPVAMMVIGMVEGVLYFTKTDAEFVRIYQQGHKNWF